MDEKDKSLLHQALCDDIETLLEEFEEATGRQVFTIKVSRVEVDEKKCHKAFEYIVKIPRGKIDDSSPASFQDDWDVPGMELYDDYNWRDK